MKEQIKEINYGTIETETLPYQITDRILALIEEKHLRPGDRLPAERELAEMMGVSRPVLREALRALSIMKVIENHRRAGTFITSLRPEQLVEHLEFVFSLDDSTYLALIEARKVVEPGLAELAAQRITPDELEKLEKCIGQMEANIDNPLTFLENDLELHQVICEIAQNSILCRLMSSITKLGIHSRKRTSESPQMRATALKDHQRIVAALRENNPDSAFKSMKVHLEHVEHELQKLVKGTNINNPETAG